MGPIFPDRSFGMQTAISLHQKRLEAHGRPPQAVVFGSEAKGISARAALASFQFFLSNQTMGNSRPLVQRNIQHGGST